MSYSFSKVCSNVLPAGIYKAQISDVRFKSSSDGSTQYNMEVRYVISEGPYAKRTVVDTIYEKAFSFRLKPFLTAIGIDMAREFETAKELYNYGICESKDKFVMIEVGVRTYNGNEYNEIRTWAPVASSTTTADEVLKEFAASPNVMPKMPHIDDLPEPEASGTTPDVAADPIAQINGDDLPF